ncbi:sigma-70 family RNA polymerase sigma factor [Guyparkeria sp. 1SP6A2]|nr:sigma-70 family RNA polymerase sigma factor [Guyparkeria sp. 1SP6A2]
MLTEKDITPYLEERRGDLLRFAQLQLGERQRAEDVVQETLMAALDGVKRFERRSQVKSWVFGILKHKIIDEIRRSDRERRLGDIAPEGDEVLVEQLFNRHGFWRGETRPSRWVDPDESLENRQFWQIFEACLTHLPDRTARVFMMREILELETKEICANLGISTSNCWVILHRARLGLRHCLSREWFEEER